MTCRQMVLTTLLLIAAQSAFALEPLMSIAELARRADIVLVGETVEARSEWNPSRTMIFTTVRERVVDGLLLKGDAPGGEIVWRQPGGRVGNILTTVHDGPVFKPGERALLFLIAPARIGLVPTVGGDIGKIDVVTDEGQQAVVLLWRQGTDLYPAPPSPRAQLVRVPVRELRALLGPSVGVN